MKKTGKKKSAKAAGSKISSRAKGQAGMSKQSAKAATGNAKSASNSEGLVSADIRREYKNHLIRAYLKKQ